MPIPLSSSDGSTGDLSNFGPSNFDPSKFDPSKFDLGNFELGNFDGAAKHDPLRQRSKGFTLLELMVVIAIVGILAGFLTVNLNIKNTPKSIHEQSLRLGLLMQIASDQAVYSRAQLGIRFHPESYEFYFLAPSEDGPGAWEMLEDDKLRFKPIDEKLVFQADISGLPIILETLEDEKSGLNEDEQIKPHIIFVSNGEIMPDFAVVVADEEEQYRHRIFSGEEEPIVVERIE